MWDLSVTTYYSVIQRLSPPILHLRVDFPRFDPRRYHLIFRSSSVKSDTLVSFLAALSAIPSLPPKPFGLLTSPLQMYRFLSSLSLMFYVQPFLLQHAFSCFHGSYGINRPLPVRMSHTTPYRVRYSRARVVMKACRPLSSLLVLLSSFVDALRDRKKSLPASSALCCI